MIEELTIDSISLPKNWKMLPFGEVCEISGGSQPPKSTFIYEPKEGYIRLVQVRDYRTEKFITYIPKERAKKFCSKTDIMIGRYGPPIFGIFRGIEGAYNVALMKAIPNKELLNEEYLYWFLKTDTLVKFVEKSSKRAAGQDGVRKEVLYTYPTPIPPLNQQKLLVDIIIKAFAAIGKAKANAEQNLQNAKELFESYLQNVFENKGDDWEEKTLAEVCEINPKKSEVNNLPENHLVSFLPMRDLGVAQNQINPITTKQLSEVKGSYTYFRNNDVLLAKVTPCFENGKLGIAKNLKNEIGFGSSEYIVFRPKNEILAEYLFYILSSSKFRNRGKELMYGAVGLKRLSRDYVKNFITPFPSVEKQKVITENINTLKAQTKKLEAIYTQKIADLEEMKKSILQKAFSGQLNTLI